MAESATVKYMDKEKRLTDSAIDRFCMATLAAAMIQRKNALLKMSMSGDSDTVAMSKPLGWVRSHSICKIIRETERHYKNRCKRKGTEDEDETDAMSEEARIKLRRCSGLADMETKEVDISIYDTILFSLFDKEHWSIMVCYVASTGAKKLYHYDSNAPYHTSYAVRARDALVNVGLLPEGTSLYSCQRYPKQKSFFECGYSVLMLASCIALQYREKKTKEETKAGVIPLSENEYPSLTKEGAMHLSRTIYVHLGNNRKGEYPSEITRKRKRSDGNETALVNGTKKCSLLTRYNLMRQEMIKDQMKAKHVPVV